MSVEYSIGYSTGRLINSEGEHPPSPTARVRNGVINSYIDKTLPGYET